jgi:hypothetical protein
MSRKPQSNFWVSYSDLATGLMIVFMVVMLLMVLKSVLLSNQQQVERETQRESVAEIVRQIQVILGARRSVSRELEKTVAEEMNTGVSDKISVDPVTAQLSIPEGRLAYERGQYVLPPKGRNFLDLFAPRYFCALWKHENAQCDGCERVDPNRPQGVRRVLIAGHGDLDGTSDDTMLVAVERAKGVEVYVRSLLSRCASQYGCSSADSLPNECSQNMDLVYNYAQERLWAASGGDTTQCNESLASLSAQGKPVSASCATTKDLVDQTSDPHRRVEFILELTGDDMTGMLLDVRELQLAVGTTPDLALDELAHSVAAKCLEDEDSYHGCGKFKAQCCEPSIDQKPSFCDGYNEAFCAMPTR